MKLQHLAHQGKQKIKEFTNKTVELYNSTNFYQNDRPSNRSCSSEKPTPNQRFNLDSEYCFKSKIHDLIEGYTDWHIPKGNHCIIGNKKQIKILADYLMEASDSQIDLVDSLDFLQSDVSGSLLNPDIRLVIMEVEAISPQLIYEVISKCHQIYFYRPNNILKYCRYKQEYYVPVHLKFLVNEIATSLGMDMEQALDILCGMLIDEFLEVSQVNGRKAVRKLPSKAEEILNKG